MTKEEILNKCTWELNSIGEFTAYSDFFKSDIKINLFLDDILKRPLTGGMVSSVNDFLNLSEEYKPLMSELLHRHCLKCCEEASYGFESKDGETLIETNLREFGVSNENDAFNNANLDHISINDDEMADRANRYVMICFYPPWEQEHGCALVLKNGVLLDYFGEHDTYLTDFE